MKKSLLMASAAVVLCTYLSFGSGEVYAWEEENRTENRSPSGADFTASWMLNPPPWHELTAFSHNWDPQNQHPAQWKGQDWDPSMWDLNWTPEIAVGKFFESKIFYGQYMSKNAGDRFDHPVLELGPRFYKLSDLDQRRCLKLMGDYTKVFDMGWKAVELRDWHTKKMVGNFTPKGMYLN